MPNFAPSPAPTSSRPTLRMGSIGEAVRLLQGALNVWPQSKLPPLATDANFGPKTGGKVREFQSANKLVPDTVVGPMTWAQIEPWIKEITKAVPIPGDDAAMGMRIVNVAEAALSTLGFLEGETPSPGSAHIAAAVCAGEFGGQRMRQGGLALQQIMMIAEVGGASPGRCPTITTDAEKWWQVQTKEGTNWRNANDLPAWCGIFCIYVYRSAGINVPGGWSNHGKNVYDTKIFRIQTDLKTILPGAIGVVDGYGGRNHHFIVTGNDGSSNMTSIDGNAFGPNANDKSKGVQSVIARNSYTYTSLKAEKAYFLFPATQAPMP